MNFLDNHKHDKVAILLLAFLYTPLIAKNKKCSAGMTHKQVTDTVVSAINRNDIQAFRSCLAKDIQAQEPGRKFSGKAAVLSWARAEIFSLSGKLKVLQTNSAAGYEIRCGKFYTPSFSFKVKYVFRSHAGKLLRWDLYYWKSKSCKWN
ncbi:MAG: hypothetical protein AAF518_15375 [Spirochaetota bacterium]